MTQFWNKFSLTLLLTFLLVSCGRGLSTDLMSASGGHDNVLYVGNTNDQSIAAFNIDPQSGQFSYLGKTTVQGTSGLQDLWIDPVEGFAFVLTTATNPGLSYFQIATDSGLLAQIGSPFNPIGSGAPLKITVDPIHHSIYSIGTSIVAAHAYGSRTTGPTLISPPGNYGCTSMIFNTGSLTQSAPFLFLGGTTSICTLPVSSADGGLSNGITTSGYNFSHFNGYPKAGYLYGANSTSGTLTALYNFNASGTPSGFNQPLSGSGFKSIRLSPNGQYLVQLSASTIYSYRITGNPNPGSINTSPISALPTGGAGVVAMSFDRSGHFVFVSDCGAQMIQEYRIDSASGVLTSSGSISNVPGLNCPALLTSGPG